MKFVVIESPYAGDVEQNLTYLNLCILDCLVRGETPYASHLMLTKALDDLIPWQRKVGIEAGLAVRRIAKNRVFYTDLGWSNGMIAARAKYENEGLSFSHRELDVAIHVERPLLAHHKYQPKRAELLLKLAGKLP